MNQDLHGKWVLLSGAASGIGRETCLLLAREGCNFVVIDIDLEGLNRIADELKAMGSSVISKVVDVTKKDQIEQLVAEVTADIGTVDILVNNAGIGFNADLRHTTDADWHRLMNINFFAVIDMTNAFLPSMMRRGGGQIVNMSTGQVFFPVPTWGAYAASKAALATYSECLTWELACFKIRVTTVFPGLISTPFYKDVRATTFAQKLVLWYINALGSTPEVMAKKIVGGIKRRRRRVIQSFINWMDYYVKRLAPMAFDMGGDAFAMALCDRRKDSSAREVF
ncbi:MAG: SDR family NAD(P)-dependent oxidoreductase [Candidatus Geothermincolia bacterium]